MNDNNDKWFMIGITMIYGIFAAAILAVHKRNSDLQREAIKTAADVMKESGIPVDVNVNA